MSAGGPNGGGSTPYGAETHVQSQAELATHTHTDAGHTHAPGSGYGNFVVGNSGSYGYNNGSGSGVFAGIGQTATGYANIQPTGSSSPMNIMNPFAVVNYIIRYQ
jgi:microcystin-dependent protein